MKKTLIIAALSLLATGTVAGTVFYQQNMEKDSTIETQLKEMTSLKNTISQLDKEQKDLRTIVVEYTKRLESIKNENQHIARLENKIQQRDQEITIAQDTILSLRDQMANARSQTRAGENTVISLNHALNTAQSRIQTLKGQIEKSSTDHAALKIEISELQEQKEKDEKDLKAQLLTEQNTVLSLNGKIEQAQAQIQAGKNSDQALREKIKTAQAQIEESRTRYIELKLRISGIQTEKGSVEHKLKVLKSTYDALVNELHTNIKSKEATIRECEEKLAVSFVDGILFTPARANISPEGRNILKKTGNILKKIRHGMIRIAGHTDDKPIKSRFQKQFPTNWELSSARAAAVARYFQKENGIAPERIEVVGYSFYHPIASNKTKEGRTRNRRVEIIVAPFTLPSTSAP